MWREPTDEEQLQINQKLKYAYLAISIIFYVNAAIALYSSVHHIYTSVKNNELITEAMPISIVLFVFGLLLLILPKTIIKIALFQGFSICIATVGDATDTHAIIQLEDKDGNMQKLLCRLPRNMKNKNVKASDSLLIAGQIGNTKHITVMEIIILDKVVSL